MKKIGYCAVLFLTLSIWVLPAMAESYEEGVHYELIVPAQPTSTGDKVEVLETFWYGCPHCFRFEPFIERWLRKKPENAEFVRLPAIFRPAWEVHARTFYAMELMGVWDKVHMPLFNAIHVMKKTLGTQESIAEFVADLGVDKEKFNKTYRSFAVETRVRRAKTMVSRYGIEGVPAVVVNGKYRVSNRMTGGAANTIKVINYLVEKETKKEG